MTEAHLNDVISRAHTAFRIGEIDLSEKLIRSLGGKLPPNPSINLLLGNIQSKRGRFEEAVKEYRTALDIQPDNAEAHNNLGVIYRKLGRLPDSISELRKAADIDPGRADIHYNLGNAYKQADDLERAAAEYRIAIERNPSFTLAYNNLGTLYDRIKRYENAEEVYRKGLETDRNNPSLRYNLGVNFQSRNQLEQAKESFRAALKARPGWVDGLNNLGIVLHKLGEEEESIRTFTSILRRDPRNFTAKNNIGTVYHAMGNREKAEKYYEAALADNPSYMKAGLNLGALLTESGAGREAYGRLSSLLLQDPNDVELRLLLAKAASDLGKNAECESHLVWILEREPGNTRALKQLGLHHFKNGDFERGEWCFRRILALDPNARNVGIELAAHYRNQGKYDEAERELRTLIAKNDSDFEARLLLGELYLEQNKHREAAGVFSKILERNPDDYRALRGLARAFHALGETQRAAEAANTLVNLQGYRATPDDLSTLNDSLSLYEEVLKPFEASFDDSWEESMREAVLQDGNDAEIPDLKQGMEEERDSLLFYGLDDLEEYAPTLLDVEPETYPYPNQPTGLPGPEPVPAANRPSPRSPQSPQHPDRPAPPSLEPGPSTPNRSLRDLVPENQHEDVSSLFREAEKEMDRPVRGSRPPAPPKTSGADRYQASMNQAPGPMRISEPLQFTIPGTGGEPYPVVHVVIHQSPEPFSPDPAETAEPSGSIPEKEPEVETVSTEEPSADEPSGEETRPEHPSTDEELPVEIPDLTIVPAGEEGPGEDEAIPEQTAQNPTPPAADFAAQEAKLLDHLLKLSTWLPEEKKNDPATDELRLRAELLKARLLGRQGLKRELERRSGYVLPEPSAKIDPSHIERTFQYLSNLIESYPDPETGLALKAKVSHILNGIRQLHSEKDPE